MEIVCLLQVKEEEKRREESRRETQRIQNNVAFQGDYCDSQTLLFFFPLRKNILYIPQLLSKQAVCV